ncbi:unnamed protein product [Zymoseptoria tritici ST99CH_1E4]|uniref:Fatty acid hydroxylase domain-containing protein n=1 Tax=Zymoseptoria tritici ST99CH_1E4 TaxID=1276532 RepID=A0A2H1FMI9_ZYMTR|nr:unnamed protein product [Zymoseptoria tritici ST99CH_1E4]
MSALVQTARDTLQYAYRYSQGRYASFGLSTIVAKASNLVSIPLPLLSLFAVPLFGGSTTRMSLVAFYLTWSALLLSHDPLKLELYGTLAIRLIFFVLPALLFLAFDCSFPQLSKNIKSRGRRALPGQLGRNRVLEIVGVAIGNVLLAVFFQAALELLWVRVFRFRSLLKGVSKVPTVPLPWSVAINLIQGFVIRGAAHYAVHRYLLHAYRSIFKTWHLRWQHSVALPFSIVAAYDHPAVYLVSVWLPTILPAYLFRWHVLTWQLFLVLTSLEELFIFSGYNVLPSAIMLTGMARRIEAHFDSVKSAKDLGNFGNIGLLDYAFGTHCKGHPDVVDDIQDEASKHRLQERIDDAVTAALESQKNNSDGNGQSSSTTGSSARGLLNKLKDSDRNADQSGGGARQPRRSGRKG